MNSKTLEKEILKKRIIEFISIIKDVPKEYWEEEHFLYDLNEKWKYSLFTEEKNKIKGFVIASKKPQSIHIHKFMVQNSERSKGIGLMLLNDFELKCLSNNDNLITLKVYKDNGRAVVFYLKNGFEIINCKKDLLLLQKRLLKDT